MNLINKTGTFILEAEQMIMENKLDKEYLPISGLGDFTKCAIELALGKGNEWSSNGLVSVLIKILLKY